MIDPLDSLTNDGLIDAMYGDWKQHEAEHPIRDDVPPHTRRALLKARWERWVRR